MKATPFHHVADRTFGHAVESARTREDEKTRPVASPVCPPTAVVRAARESEAPAMPPAEVTGLWRICVCGLYLRADGAPTGVIRS